MKYVIITGGVVSGLGKGIIASSIGLLLKSSGFRVTAIKIDPYLNIDAGTMSPYEHGEVFVLDDGGEVDLDLGNYERFLNITLTKEHNITTGKIYDKIIKEERKGVYLGKTIQMVPHVSNEIQNWIERVSKLCVKNNEKPEICIIELGGTVGDIESMIFLEAIRQFKYKNNENVCHVHVSLIVNQSKSLKSKPTQHSMITLRSTGLIPDCIVLRCKNKITNEIIDKISLFSMVQKSNIICVHDVKNIYKVPQLLLEQNILNIVHKGKLKKEPDISKFNKIANRINNINIKTIKIAIVGKYTGLSDSYISLTKALLSAAFICNLQIDILWIESNDLLNKCKLAWNKLKSSNGILIPGGFGDRGIEGKILAVNYARINKIPFLGICLGLQIAIIEYCRNILHLKNSNSEEFNKNSEHKVIISTIEGKMRLGSRKCHIINKNSIAYKLYNKTEIYERHRHRYEVNTKYINVLSENGLLFTAKDSLNNSIEIIELPSDKHPFFFACQYHPEFKSGPLKPSPPFNGFIKSIDTP